MSYDKSNQTAKDILNIAMCQNGKSLLIRKKYAEALNVLKSADPGYECVGKTLFSVKKVMKKQAEIHYLQGVKYFLNEELQSAIKEWETTLILDSVFCFVWTSCFWTPLRISTSPFRLPFYFVERIGLTFDFDSLPVARIMNWIISAETVCWEKDPVSGHSLCSWFVCIILICPRKNSFCLTISRENKHAFIFTWVFALGSSFVSSDITCL